MMPVLELLVEKEGAARICFRDQSVLFVAYGALDVSHRAAPLDQSSFRCKLWLPHGTKEIDLQFDCG